MTDYRNDESLSGYSFAQTGSEEEEGINIRDFLLVCIHKWKRFVVSIVAVMALASFYLLVTPNVYTRSASVMIKDEDGSNTSVTSALSDLGLFKTSTNVANELLAFQSPALMADVVKRLDLQNVYSYRKFLKKTPLYGDSSVIHVAFPDYSPNAGASFKVEILGKGKVLLSKMRKGNEKFSGTLEVALGDTVNTPMGRLVVTPGPGYSTSFDHKISVQHMGISSAIKFYQGEMKISLADEDASVIDFVINDQSAARADDILNTLISIYNEKWVDDKEEMAMATSNFITDRLGVIEKELGNVDSDIAQYKGENLIPDVQAAAEMYMKSANDNEEKQVEVSTQLSILRYLLEFATSTANSGKLLPTNTGLDNAGIQSQVMEYNKAILERERLLLSTGETSPLIKQYDQAISNMRGALIAAMRNQEKAVQTQLTSLIKNDRGLSSRIASSPGKAKYLLSVERQQKVKESLYLFLLQKREENELSLAFTPYNTRIITPPMGPSKPTSPVARNILIMAFLAGVIIPMVVLFVETLLNNTLRSRSDLDKLRTPLIGEIPEVADSKTKIKRWKRYWRNVLGKASQIEDAPALMVHAHGTTVINESFRMARSTFEMMARNGRNKIVMTTSFNPGSGKTFISLNLAAALALKKKGGKVLAIDLDLRRASLSRVLPSRARGIADYLTEQIDDVRPYIQSTPCEGLEILPVGSIPPNPSELLYSDRLKNLLENLRGEYDFIFLDCPPSEVVADASIIAPLADLTIFVLRAGLIDRRMLPEVDRIYDSHRFNNFMIILNGTDAVATPYRRYVYSNYYTKKDEIK